MQIAMIGTGYVGLVSGVCFSDFGHDVICVDKDPAKIARLEGGEVPIYEPGLETLMAKNVEAGRLTFTTDLGAAVAGAEAVFIAVGTPTRRGGGGGAMLARAPEAIRLGDVVALLEADQALVECFAVGGGTCTLTPHCRLRGRLAEAEAAFIADLNRGTLADCVIRLDGV